MMSARLILAILGIATLLGGLPALADNRHYNPCGFGSQDNPCRLEDGVYRALVPPGIGPHPAIIYLYGSMGKSRSITDAAYFRREVVNRGYALIVPAATDALYQGGERGTGWGWSGRKWTIKRDDFDFVRRVILDAQRRHNIDPKRIIFAGQSDGGFFIWEIACHRPELGTAFAVHAGAYGNRLPGKCRQPVRFLHTHGTQDRIVDLTGRRAGGLVAHPPVKSALDMLAKTNRCAKGPLNKGRYFGFRRTGWEGCAPGSAIDYLEHSGGHFWPRGWMPAVIDWFERTEFKPANSVTRRVGDGGGSLFKQSGSGSGRFKTAPTN